MRADQRGHRFWVKEERLWITEQKYGSKSGRFLSLLCAAVLVCLTVCGGGVLCRLVNNHKGSRKKEGVREGTGYMVKSRELYLLKGFILCNAMHECHKLVMLRYFYSCMFFGVVSWMWHKKVRKWCSHKKNCTLFLAISSTKLWHKDLECSLNTLHKQRCFHVFTTPLSLSPPFPRLTTVELRITQLTPGSCGCGCHWARKGKKAGQLGNGEATKFQIHSFRLRSYRP